MGRACKICSSVEFMRVAAEMIAAGCPDRAVAETLGGMNRMAVQRHRASHMAGRPGVVARQRESAETRLGVLKNMPDEPFDAGTYLSRDSIAADLDAIDRRLSVAAVSAAVDGRSAVLAQLSAQQLRLAETRAKLGETGGYGRDRANGGGSGGPFSVTISVRGDLPPLTVTSGHLQDSPAAPVDAAWPAPPRFIPELHPLATGAPAAVFRSRAVSA